MHVQWSSGWEKTHLTVPRLVNITPIPSPVLPWFFHKLILLLPPPHDPPLQNLRSPRDHEGGDGVEGPADDHVWFEDRWMVTSWCDESLTTLCGLILG
jgi:hypothetical protein